MTLQERLLHIKHNQKPSLLRFLSLTEQQLTKGICKEHAQFDGGYKEAEYKRAFLYQDSQPSQIVCFQITANTQFVTLTHQNILGSLMALSIERNAIGDILPKQGVFFAIRELQKEILNSFQSISDVPITLSIIDGSSVTSEQDFTYHTAIVSSLRLDTVVSTLSGVSRKQATQWIEREMVKVNHEVDTKCTRNIGETAILSIRKQGRFQLLDGQGRTRKDKIVLNYRKFV